MHQSTLPDGFVKASHSGGFEKFISELYVKQEQDNKVIFGFFVGEDHSNMGGSIHGGILMTSADHLMAAEILRQPRRPNRIATIQMDSHFLSRARPGDFLMCQCAITKTTRHVIFVEGLIFTDKRSILRATGIWKIVDPA